MHFLSTLFLEVNDVSHDTSMTITILLTILIPYLHVSKTNIILETAKQGIQNNQNYGTTKAMLYYRVYTETIFQGCLVFIKIKAEQFCKLSCCQSIPNNFKAALQQLKENIDLTIKNNIKTRKTKRCL